MKTLTIAQHNLSKVQEIARNTQCEVEIGQSYQITAAPSNLSLDVVEVTITAVQSTGDERILAKATRETLTESFVRTFSPEAFTNFDFDHVDYQRCDKCGAKHNRKSVFMVHTASDGYMQVGGQCAKNLNCEVHCERLVRALDKFDRQFEKSDLPVFHRDYSSWESFYDFTVDEILRVAAAVIKRDDRYYTDGMVSDPYSEFYGNVSTPVRVREFFPECENTNPPTIDRHQLVRCMLSEAEQADGYWLDRVVTWLLNEEATDYVHNTKVAIFNPGRSIRWGLLVSAVWQVIKEDRRLAREAEKQNYTKPTDGQQIALDGEVVKTSWKEDFYGNMKCGVTVKDRVYGNLWFGTTARWVDTLDAGDIVRGQVQVRSVKDGIAFVSAPKKPEIIKGA